MLVQLHPSDRPLMLAIHKKSRSPSHCPSQGHSGSVFPRSAPTGRGPVGCGQGVPRPLPESWCCRLVESRPWPESSASHLLPLASPAGGRRDRVSCGGGLGGGRHMSPASPGLTDTGDTERPAGSRPVRLTGKCVLKRVRTLLQTVPGRNLKQDGGLKVVALKRYWHLLSFQMIPESGASPRVFSCTANTG